MLIILVTLLAFVIPVVIFLLLELKKKRAQDALDGIKKSKKNEPVSMHGLVKVTVILVLAAIPVYFASDLPYSYNTPGDALLKVAFKHSGKRIADCEESDFVKKEGERYRQQLRDTKQVKMSMTKMAKCPRERHPVVLELYIDGRKAMDKSYAATGMKSDMASYIYDEFKLEPGTHHFKALLYDKGTKDEPAYTMESTALVKAQEVKVIWFNEKADSLVLE